MFEPCTLTAEAVRLFRLLSARLRDINPDRFDLDAWYDKKYGNIGCGTTACAMGYACLMPEFNEVGLRPSRRDALTAGHGFPELRRGGLVFSDWAAVREVFGINYHNADLLFSSAYDESVTRASPVMVADRIDQFVVLYGPKETADV